MAKRKTTVRKHAPTKKLSAVIRVSKRAGRDTARWMTKPQQVGAIKRWAKAHGYDPENDIIWHDETDSVSGKTTNRVGLRAAMKEVRDGVTDGLIVAKLDRFSRSLIEGLAALREIKESGGQFIAVNDGIHDWSADDPMDNLRINIMLAVAQWQWESLKLGWEDVDERHIAAGVANAWPFGFIRDEDTRKLVHDPKWAPVVLEMFERRAAGESLVEIADWLTSLKAPTKGKGKRWTHSQVSVMLKCRAYLGELHKGELSNLTAHDGIVDVALFERAQAVGKRTGRRAARVSYPLAGMVRCSTCGGRMAGRTDTAKGVAYRYYRCRRTYNWGQCTAPVSVRADELEAVVEARFRGDYLSGKKARGTSTLARDLEAAKAKMAAAETTLKTWLASPTTQASRELLGDAAVEEQGEGHVKAVRMARAAVQALSARAVAEMMPTDLTEEWEHFDDDERRRLLALAYPVVAVRPTITPRMRHNGSAEAVADRVRIWGRTDDDFPADLPGIGGTRGTEAKARPLNVAA